MSLYYEASDILANAEAKGGSLKNRIFGKKDLKSSPGAIFALVAETTKWSSVLKEVIEKADILKLEKKLTPTLALLLAHDLILAKKGVAAPKSHPLNLAISRHKARLNAEFTKCRIKGRFATLDAFRIHINAAAADESAEATANGTKAFHPRWVRVNAVRTTMAKAQSTFFADFTLVSSLKELSTTPKGLYLDEHIPDLVAIHPGIDLSKHAAYHAGEIIFQDKASCFPAYLLDPTAKDGQVIDACAAPGNKTTHLAAILSSQKSYGLKASVTACERNPIRAQTLEKMVKLAGAGKIISVKASQDFTKLDPRSQEFADVGALLLDPSCSGSGIIGRDDTAVLHLPSVSSTTPGPSSTSSKKRKRKASAAVEVPIPVVAEAKDELSEETPQAADLENDEEKLKTRLENLSGFQLKIVLHAFAFPAATKVTYSTCSIHVEENESVVVRALSSKIARQRGWKIMKREEQVEGMKKWARRGDPEASKVALKGKEFLEDPSVLADACIRCERGTDEGTMGFFVAGFVRDPDADVVQPVAPKKEESDGEDEEWGGFDE
ncbi:S-adenosyl-L-methionine-dependent methyltransferase [Aureobasidium subglaciale]|nr:S-adenosyl-L-methionine-dependent methyltransferase [Aureobasidium subglaciale]